MTHREKIQLHKLIQNLPRDNLVQVVGVLRRSDSSKTNLCDDITIDLEKEVRPVLRHETLWRLYYYVRAVEKARKLSAIQDAQINLNAKV
ncbi:hypothetical protein EUGRSUZ_F01485 [Eucalyptus grandis]|uniref:Uncharacterized protein n=2 Tax=Eucalyptus grandis TaxID=71139 RepID=A0ACC3KEA9_EUCGR|nr:hypothetical protein EUGRSUZ_F01485 [Eucalyptus grandis]